MKTITQLTFLITLLLGSCMYSQNMKGIATYMSQRKFDIQLDSTVSDGMRDQITAMLKKQSQKEFKLTFTDNESLYKEEIPLDNTSTVSGGGMQFTVMTSGGDDELYKNLSENRYASQVELFGKQFLVKDALEKQEWKLVNETKNIGQYTCFKATNTTTRTVMVSETTKEGEEGSGDTRKEEEEIVITAWYTPQIPISNGPANYNGLPGLILEINDGSETILCSKIVLNPEGGVAIKEPSKGKVVTDAEYRDIMEKKMQEMNEQFQTDNRKGGEKNSFSIRIGG